MMSSTRSSGYSAQNSETREIKRIKTCKMVLLNRGAAYTFGTEHEFNVIIRDFETQGADYTEGSLEKLNPGRVYRFEKAFSGRDWEEISNNIGRQSREIYQHIENKLTEQGFRAGEDYAGAIDAKRTMYDTWELQADASINPLLDLPEGYDSYGAELISRILPHNPESMKRSREFSIPSLRIMA